MTGKIKRVIEDRQFGFISGDDNNEYFFHASDLVGIQFNVVDAGMKVEFEPKTTVKGLRASEVRDV